MLCALLRVLVDCPLFGVYALAFVVCLSLVAICHCALDVGCWLSVGVSCRCWYVVCYCAWAVIACCSLSHFVVCCLLAAVGSVPLVVMCCWL